MAVLLSLPQAECAPTIAVPPPADLADDPRLGRGDPFSPHKILNHFERLRALVAGELAYPVTVEIDPSNRCNHRCAWCVSAAAHTGEELDTGRFRALLAELRRLDVRSVVIKGGGEPTVHRGINDMLAACVEHGLPVGLITNGSMPHAGTREAVLACAEWVRVSLDAACAATHRQIHGTADFRRIIDNVGFLAAHARRTLVGLNFAAEPRNCREITAFTQMARDLGVAYVSIRCVFDRSSLIPPEIRQEMRRQAAAARELETERFRVLLGNFTDRYLDADWTDPFPYRRCLGPNLVGVVGADGEVYACCFLRGRRDFSFGNLAGASFEEVWGGPRRREVMERVYRGECGHACIGGMTASRYNVYNEILNYLELEPKQHAEFI